MTSVGGGCGGYTADCCCLVTKSCLTLCDPRTVASQDPPPWDFPDTNTGVGCHFLRPEDLPDPGIEPRSPVLAGRFFTTEPPGKPILLVKKENGAATLENVLAVPQMCKHKITLVCS